MCAHTLLLIVPGKSLYFFKEITPDADHVRIARSPLFSMFSLAYVKQVKLYLMLQSKAGLLLIVCPPLSETLCSFHT